MLPATPMAVARWVLPRVGAAHQHRVVRGLCECRPGQALLTFNLGVEAGQLLVVCAAFVIWKLLSRLPIFGRARTPALCAMGAVAAHWSIGRVVALVA